MNAKKKGRTMPVLCLELMGGESNKLAILKPLKFQGRRDVPHTVYPKVYPNAVIKNYSFDCSVTTTATITLIMGYPPIIVIYRLIISGCSSSQYLLIFQYVRLEVHAVQQSFHTDLITIQYRLFLSSLSPHDSLRQQ